MSFRGTAGAVQTRAGGTVLSLGAGGAVRWKEHGLAGPHAAALQVTPKQLSLTLSADSPGGEYAITAPGDWELQAPATGVRVELRAGRQVVSLARGVTSVALVRGE